MKQLKITLLILSAMMFFFSCSEEQELAPSENLTFSSDRGISEVIEAEGCVYYHDYVRYQEGGTYVTIIDNKLYLSETPDNFRNAGLAVEIDAILGYWNVGEQHAKKRLVVRRASDGKCGTIEKEVKEGKLIYKVLGNFTGGGCEALPIEKVSCPTEPCSTFLHEFKRHGEGYTWLRVVDGTLEAATSMTGEFYPIYVKDRRGKPITDIVAIKGYWMHSNKRIVIETSRGCVVIGKEGGTIRPGDGGNGGMIMGKEYELSYHYKAFSWRNYDCEKVKPMKTECDLGCEIAEEDKFFHDFDRADAPANWLAICNGQLMFSPEADGENFIPIYVGHRGVEITNVASIDGYTWGEGNKKRVTITLTDGRSGSMEKERGNAEKYKEGVNFFYKILGPLK